MFALMMRNSGIFHRVCARLAQYDVDDVRVRPWLDRSSVQRYIHTCSCVHSLPLCCQIPRVLVMDLTCFFIIS